MLAFACLDCGATLESWVDIEGETIGDLTSGTNYFLSQPNTTERLWTLLEAPNGIFSDNYGRRMKGWLIPPVTGNYTFWVASNNAGELWLSTDDNPANKVLVCKNMLATYSRAWEWFPQQKSLPTTLVKGQAYYFEVRFAEFIDFKS